MSESFSSFLFSFFVYRLSDHPFLEVRNSRLDVTNGASIPAYALYRKAVVTSFLLGFPMDFSLRQLHDVLSGVYGDGLAQDLHLFPV